MAVVTLIFIVFLASTLLQLIWWLALFSRLAFYTGPSHRRPKTENKKNPAIAEAVSVIICAHNELPNLKQLIPALKSQNHPCYELIIVDDRSQDGTKEWVQSLSYPGLTLKLIAVSNCPQGQNQKNMHCYKESLQLLTT